MSADGLHTGYIIMRLRAGGVCTGNRGNADTCCYAFTQPEADCHADCHADRDARTYASSHADSCAYA